MNKNELLQKLRDKTSISMKQCGLVFDSLKAIIIDAINKGQKISIANFGVVKKKIINRQKKYSPNKKQYYFSKAKSVLVFKPSQSINKMLEI